MILNKLEKHVLTKEKPFFKLEQTFNFNFAYIQNIQVKDSFSKPSELTLHIKRIEATGRSTEKEFSLALHETDFVLKDNLHVLQTSNIDFFKQGDNFGVKSRSIEIGVSNINPDNDFEVTMFVMPLEGYANL